MSFLDFLKNKPKVIFLPAEGINAPGPDVAFFLSDSILVLIGCKTSGHKVSSNSVDKNSFFLYPNLFWSQALLKKDGIVNENKRKMRSQVCVRIVQAFFCSFKYSFPLIFARPWNLSLVATCCQFTSYLIKKSYPKNTVTLNIPQKNLSF